MATPEEVQAKVDEVVRQFQQVVKQNDALERVKEEFARETGVTLEEIKTNTQRMFEVWRESATPEERSALDHAIAEADREQRAAEEKYDTKVNVVAPVAESAPRHHSKINRQMI